MDARGAGTRSEIGHTTGHALRCQEGQASPFLLMWPGACGGWAPPCNECSILRGKRPTFRGAQLPFGLVCDVHTNVQKSRPQSTNQALEFNHV